MYERFLKDAKSQYPGFPDVPSPDMGLAIKQIRLRMGMTQDELARDAKMKAAALKTLENGYAKFTRTENLEAIARVLRISSRDIVLEGREWFPGNFFVLKLAEPVQEGRRKKFREDVWFKRKPLLYGNYSIDFISPPIVTPGHFSFLSMDINPGKQISGLKLPYPNQLAGFVLKGTLKIRYENREVDIFGNQSFVLRGDKPHDFFNMDKDNALRLVLLYSLVPSKIVRPEPKKAQKQETSLSIGKAIRTIRDLYSDSKNRPLSFSELSYLTGLDDKALQYLEGTTRQDQVVYWDKIEKITQSLKMPLPRFLDLAEGRDEGYLHVATAHDRALIDYRHYLGVRIKSALFPSVMNAFHLSETYIEPKGGIRRATWKRTDQAMIAVNVEDGELFIEVGKNRKVGLKEGESIYFDASLGYIFTNAGTKPAKLIIATYPAIIF